MSALQIKIAEHPQQMTTLTLMNNLAIRFESLGEFYNLD